MGSTSKAEIVQCAPFSDIKFFPTSPVFGFLYFLEGPFRKGLGEGRTCEELRGLSQAEGKLCKKRGRRVDSIAIRRAISILLARGED
jgi:hypothetical protein